MPVVFSKVLSDPFTFETLFHHFEEPFTMNVGVPIFKDIPPICPCFLGFRVGKYAWQEYTCEVVNIISNHGQKLEPCKPRCIHQGLLPVTATKKRKLCMTVYG